MAYHWHSRLQSASRVTIQQEDDVPTYAYACTACEHRFEVQQAFSDAALTECPECAGRLRKLFNSVGIVFKGSGFYRTDSRAKDTSSAGSSSSAGDTASSGSGSSGSGSSGSSGSGDKAASSPAAGSSTSSSTSSSSSTTSSSSAA
jgi:putative FmdB family regulatory protein